MWNREEIQAKEDIKVENYLRLAYKIATYYRGKGVSYEDLKSASHEALAIAYNDYDPEKGHAFIAYVYQTVRNTCKRAIRDVNCGKRKSLLYASNKDGETADIWEYTPNQFDIAAHNERVELLHKHLPSLPERWQYIINKRYIEPSMNEEARYETINKGSYSSCTAIAEEFGVSRQRVSEMERLALQRLKDLIHADLTNQPLKITGRLKKKVAQ